MTTPTRTRSGSPASANTAETRPASWLSAWIERLAVWSDGQPRHHHHLCYWTALRASGKS